MAAPPRADFKLILDAINPAQAAAIIAELMEVLNIDRRTATAATQQAPLVLVGGMSQQQAAIARTHVVRLARLGARLRLTAEPIGKLKTLTWKTVPQFVRRPGNLFVCPSCGERFLVQRWQHQPAQAAAPVAAAHAPAAAPAQPVEAEPVEAEPIEAEPVEPEPVAEEPEAVGEPEPVEEAQPEAPAEEPLEAEEPLDAEAEEALAEAEPLMAEPIEAEPLEAEPIEEPEPEPEPYEVREPEPDLEPGVAPEAATMGPVYDVSVAKVRGPKQDRLAELIAERLRISFEEASRMCERTIIMVCKGAPESEAASWRKALASLGLKPRIRKRT